MLRVIHFEIQADDTDRASKFYTDVFNWDFKKWEGGDDYRVITTGPSDQPGINGGMLKRRGPINYVNTIDVPSLSDYLDKVTKAGGQMVVPPMTIPNVGELAYCMDTEGNVFGIVEPVRKDS